MERIIGKDVKKGVVAIKCRICLRGIMKTLIDEMNDSLLAGRKYNACQVIIDRHFNGISDFLDGHKKIKDEEFMKDMIVKAGKGDIIEMILKDMNKKCKNIVDIMRGQNEKVT